MSVSQKKADDVPVGLQEIDSSGAIDEEIQSVHPIKRSGNLSSNLNFRNTGTTLSDKASFKSVKNDSQNTDNNDDENDIQNLRSFSLYFKKESLNVEWTYLAIKKKKYLVLVGLCFALLLNVGVAFARENIL